MEKRIMHWEFKIPRSIRTGTDRERLHNPEDVSTLKSLMNYLGNLLSFHQVIVSHVSSTRLFRSLELNGHFARHILSQFERSFVTKPRFSCWLLCIFFNHYSNFCLLPACNNGKVNGKVNRRKQKFLKLHSNRIFVADRFLPNSKRWHFST